MSLGPAPTREPDPHPLLMGRGGLVVLANMAGLEEGVGSLMRCGSELYGLVVFGELVVEVWVDAVGRVEPLGRSRNEEDWIPPR